MSIHIKTSFGSLMRRWRRRRLADLLMSRCAAQPNSTYLPRFSATLSRIASRLAVILEEERYLPVPRSRLKSIEALMHRDHYYRVYNVNASHAANYFTLFSDGFIGK